MKWIRLLIRYGPAFLSGKRYLKHSLLSDEILYAGLECARQTGESLMEISLSYRILKLNAIDGFIVIWNDRWTHLIVKQQGRWCIRYTPDILDRVGGINGHGFVGFI